MAELVLQERPEVAKAARSLFGPGLLAFLFRRAIGEGKAGGAAARLRLGLGLLARRALALLILTLRVLSRLLGGMLGLLGGGSLLL